MLPKFQVKTIQFLSNKFCMTSPSKPLSASTHIQYNVGALRQVNTATREFDALCYDRILTVSTVCTSHKFPNQRFKYC